MLVCLKTLPEFLFHQANRCKKFPDQLLRVSLSDALSVDICIHQKNTSQYLIDLSEMRRGFAGQNSWHIGCSLRSLVL